MTDEEFDVLNELYFVQSFSELKSLTEKPADELVRILESLYQSGWIKVLENVDEEKSSKNIDFNTLKDSENYFLATKRGLMAHNTK